ncbi:hypothetical protein PC129_g19540 [Phytophthora cactorum]|nr:hypothetical protein PC129_g19540 [Phytophthora cactorum]
MDDAHEDEGLPTAAVLSQGAARGEDGVGGSGAGVGVAGASVGDGVAVWAVVLLAMIVVSTKVHMLLMCLQKLVRACTSYKRV